VSNFCRSCCATQFYLSVHIYMIISIFYIIRIIWTYIFFSNVTDPVTGSSCHNDRPDRLTTLRLIPRLISLSLRLYPHPPRVDAFRRVMVMKDDYAKTRAISVFDLTTWNWWSTADQDESLTFTYNRYSAITQRIKVCCNVTSAQFVTIDIEDLFAKKICLGKKSRSMRDIRRTLGGEFESILMISRLRPR